MKKNLFTTKMANFNRSCLCSVLTHEQMEDLRLKGMVFIIVDKPIWKMEQKAEVVYWSLVDPTPILSDLDLSILDICVVTTYKNIKEDETLAYVGEIKGWLPDNDEKIILTMILQSIKANLGEKIDIHNLFEMCQEIKLNINKGSLSNHFWSVGGSFGIGVCHKYFVKDNLALFSQFFFSKKRKKYIFLEDGIKKGMSWVGAQLKDYVGFDVLKSNAMHLKAIAEISVMADFSEDFHIKGDARYASLFYNVDASTMQRHTEFDMNMTTIFVPNQDWEGKEKDHLQFIFHVMGDDKGILSIPMVPGTIIYFHGYLITHQQIHDNGTCMEDGCCLNYSGYANHAVLCHFIKSIEQFLKW